MNDPDRNSMQSEHDALGLYDNHNIMAMARDVIAGRLV
jgi:hypothetical protein